MGGVQKPQKLVNDLIDVNVVTFATFFDGFLTDDVRAPAVLFGLRRACDRLDEDPSFNTISQHQVNFVALLSAFRGQHRAQTDQIW